MRVNSINNQYNRSNYSSSNAKTPAFKGNIMPQKMINGLSSFYEGVAKTSVFQKFVNNFSKSNKTFTHLMTMESIFLSGFYMIGTLRNKKIKKEQKPQMIINDSLTLGVSTAGAYLLDDKVSNAVNKFTEKYFLKHSDFYTKLGENMKKKEMSTLMEKVGVASSLPKEKLSQGAEYVSNCMKSQLKNIIGEEGKLKTFQITNDKFKEVTSSVKDAISANKGNSQKAKEVVTKLVDDVYSKSAARVQANEAILGFNKLKTLVLFGIIYRYLGPVVVTPIANKLSSKIFDKNKKD